MSENEFKAFVQPGVIKAVDAKDGDRVFGAEGRSCVWHLCLGI